MGPLSGSFPTSNVPTVAEVERVAGLQDPVLRNLQITQCYSELSNALALRTGYSANWCTFATWTSKQVGQSIRKEDLQSTLEDSLSAGLFLRCQASLGLPSRTSPLPFATSGSFDTSGPSGPFP